MTKTLMHIEGMNGQVELLPDRVVIHRKGLWNAFSYGLNAKREIPLGALTEVALKPAGLLVFGEIEFVSGGRMMQARKTANPNAVKFRRDKNAAFEALKEKIFEIINQQQRQQK